MILNRKEKWTAESLHAKYPLTTLPECRRFLDAFPKHADERLAAYMEWRCQYQLDHDTAVMNFDEVPLTPCQEDALDWHACMELARAYEDSQKNKKTKKDAPSKTSSANGDDDDGDELAVRETQPTCSTHTKERRFGRNRRKAAAQASKEAVSNIGELLVRPNFHRRLAHHKGDKEAVAHEFLKDQSPLVFHYGKNEKQALKGSEGNALLYHLPALIDLHAAPPSVYAAAFGLYLERKLDRHNPDTEQARWTVLLDVRPGEGWPNHPATNMVGFIRQVYHDIQFLYPNCLHRLIIYPVPPAAVMLWKMVAVFLRPEARDKTLVLAGPAEVESGIPSELSQHVDEETIRVLEQTRLAHFVREQRP